MANCKVGRFIFLNLGPGRVPGAWLGRGGALMVALAMCVTTSQAAVISDFEADDEGWRITGDAQSGSIVPDHNVTGGNPDGHISAVDDVIGGVWYFQAPDKFLGAQSAAYGQELAFDLMQAYPNSGTTAFDTYNSTLWPDIALVGPGGLTLATNFYSHPDEDAWTPYTIVLDENADWRNNSTGDPATAGEFQSVLGDLQALRIRGEYRVGDDTGFLDNVTLVPEPTLLALLAAGAVAMVSRRPRREAEANARQ
ncbi:MAG: laminin B domain-containing protein [Phycisphaeraceae bacterium]